MCHEISLNEKICVFQIYQEKGTKRKQVTQWILWSSVTLHIVYVSDNIVNVSLLLNTTSHISGMSSSLKQPESEHLVMKTSITGGFSPIHQIHTEAYY